jgi:hypothetical protein
MRALRDRFSPAQNAASHEAFELVVAVTSAACRPKFSQVGKLAAMVSEIRVHSHARGRVDSTGLAGPAQD